MLKDKIPRYELGKKKNARKIIVWQIKFCYIERWMKFCSLKSDEVLRLFPRWQLNAYNWTDETASPR